MCSIGYTCEEIVSSLRHWQPNNKMTATFNILKHKFSHGDSHQPKGKLWLNSSHVGALYTFIPLKRAASEPAFPTVRQAGKGDVREDGEEEARDAKAVTCSSNAPPWVCCPVQMKKFLKEVP